MFLSSKKITREEKRILSSLSCKNLDIPRKPVKSPPRILLINPCEFTVDYINTRLFIHHKIPGNYYDLIKVWSLEQAINEIQLNPPDLIICSTHFPLTGHSRRTSISEEKFIGYVIINHLKGLSLNIPTIFLKNFYAFRCSSGEFSEEFKAEILNFMKTEGLAYFENLYDFSEDLANAIEQTLNLKNSYLLNRFKKQGFSKSSVSQETAHFLNQEACHIDNLWKEQDNNLTNRNILKIGEKLFKLNSSLKKEVFKEWLKTTQIYSIHEATIYIFCFKIFKNYSDKTIDNIKVNIKRLAIESEAVIKEVKNSAEAGEEINQVKLEEIKQKYNELMA